MTRNNSFNDAARMPIVSTNDVIKNLISLLAFKYQILANAAQVDSKEAEIVKERFIREWFQERIRGVG